MLIIPAIDLKDGRCVRLEPLTLDTRPTPGQDCLSAEDCGNPVLEVQILENGTLGEAVIRRSSGQPELDRAALAILRLAIPYDRSPPRLAARHDALRLVYAWQFVAGELADSAVRMPPATR